IHHSDWIQQDSSLAVKPGALLSWFGGTGLRNSAARWTYCRDGGGRRITRDRWPSPGARSASSQPTSAPVPGSFGRRTVRGTVSSRRTAPRREDSESACLAFRIHGFEVSSL